MSLEINQCTSAHAPTWHGCCPALSTGTGMAYYLRVELNRPHELCQPFGPVFAIARSVPPYIRIPVGAPGG
jgi:hypothetical protein